MLVWLRDEPSRWPVFIANRVAQIHRDLPTVKWRHVLSEENPADLASRGTDPKSLCHRRAWWSGPEWLTGSTESWPKNQLRPAEEHSELRTNQTHAVLFTQEVNDDFIQRFSHLGDLLRTVARCLRVTWLLQPSKRGTMESPLSADELDNAFLKCLRYVQRQAF